jgi:Arabinose efflux permease
LTYPVLLAFGVVDAAGYSVIGPVLPGLAVQTHSGPALMGALASAFPLAMMVGFAAAGRAVRAGHIRGLLLGALCVSAIGAVLFAVASGLPMLFASRALMGLGSGGLWIGITFATLAYWPGQEYLCMSRIYAAYAAGALLGPSLGALGGTQAPFVVYAALLVVLAPCVAVLPRLAADGFASDRSMLRTKRFWVAAVGIMVAILATGVLDGVLPLHLATRWSQAGIGVAYLVVGGLIVLGSVVAGHQQPARMLVLGATALTVGLTLAGATTSVTGWGIGLALVGLGSGVAQTGATGLLLAAVPTARIVTAMVVWSQLGIIGYLVGPAVGGVLAQNLGFAALGLVPAAAAVVLVLLASMRRLTRSAP